MAQFKHGFPGNAIGQQISIMQTKPTAPAPKAKEMSTHSSSIMDIEGIGKEYAEKLKENNIQTTNDLLEAGATPDKRKHLAEKTGLSSKLILEWVNHADLFRIKGVAGEYAELLEEAGVDTVVELSKRKPDNLYKKIEEVNEVKKIVRKLPSLSIVEGWVEEAKTLPRKIEH
jgi:predicted flap endonuclease-1-like 5' DNA nuclease